MFHRIATITSRQALQAPSIVRHGSTLRVILLQNVEGVGAAGEEHDVAAGYMRNFLYPQQIAAYRTDNNLEKYKSIMEASAAATAAGTQTQSQGSLKKRQAKLNKLKKLLSSKPVIIKRNSVDGVTCFPGEVTQKNIVDNLLKHRQINIENESNILLMDETLSFPIKNLGSYDLVYAANIADIDNEEQDHQELKLKVEDEEYVTFKLDVVKR